MYWQDRMQRAQSKLTGKSIKQVEKQLKKYYASTMKRVIADFENTYNKVLLAVEEGREPTPADLYKLDAYWQMQGQMRHELEKLGDKQISLLSKEFELHFFDIYYSIGIPGHEAFTTISKEAVTQMINSIWVADGKTFSQRIWDNVNNLVETLNEGLIHCVVTGQKTTQLKQALQERFNVSYSRADSVVRTEMAHIQTEAAKKRYQDYGVKQVQVWADEDERRCDICGKLHEQKFPVDGPMPVPVHPRCRCTVIPVIDDQKLVFKGPDVKQATKY